MCDGAGSRRGGAGWCSVLQPGMLCWHQRIPLTATPGLGAHPARPPSVAWPATVGTVMLGMDLPAHHCSLGGFCKSHSLISIAAPEDFSHGCHPVPQQGGWILNSSVFAPTAGGRLCTGKRTSLPVARPFPVIQKVMASMAHLQEEKLRLQEELLGLQEKLAARENNELSRSLQLQGQVWGDRGT